MAEMNISASPPPMRTRTPNPTGNEVASAKPSWPTVITVRPMAIVLRLPSRSSSNPAGICMPA